MRLICPNCDAEYEVDDAAIPDSGRDVQCSNCGHGWFQLAAGVESTIAEEEALFGTADEPDVQPVVDTPDAGDPTPPRRALDETLMAVLREEAEREAAARRAEAGLIETQTEMPLSAPFSEAGASNAAARRIARLQGRDPDAPPPAATPAKTGSRRELLPDIEEINSSLRATSAPRAEDSRTRAPRGRSGFRSGFVLSMLIAAGAAGAYVMAPRIAEQIPGAKPALAGYVQTVDSARLWLDGAMRNATAAIKRLTAPDNAG